MLVEELQPSFEAQPSGYDEPATFYLTINRSRIGTTWQWSAGYQDYATRKILLGTNDCETLEEVAIRLSVRLERYMRIHAPKPRTLQNMQKSNMLRNTNVMEDTIMSQPADDKASSEQAASDTMALTHGQTLVGVDFNPSANARVDKIKNLAAQMIDEIEALHTEQYPPVEGKYAGAYDVNLLQGHALRHVIDASSACVKRATWPTQAYPSNETGGAK